MPDLMEKMRKKQVAPATEPTPAVTEDAAPAKPLSKKALKRLKKAQNAAKDGENEANKFRLPHGSRFELVYDGETQQWTGVLFADGKEFRDSGTAVHWLLRKLGGQWYQTTKQVVDV